MGLSTGVDASCSLGEGRAARSPSGGLSYAGARVPSLAVSSPWSPSPGTQLAGAERGQVLDSPVGQRWCRGPGAAHGGAAAALSQHGDALTTALTPGTSIAPLPSTVPPAPALGR